MGASPIFAETRVDVGNTNRTILNGSLLAELAYRCRIGSYRWLAPPEPGSTHSAYQGGWLIFFLSAKNGDAPCLMDRGEESLHQELIRRYMFGCIFDESVKKMPTLYEKLIEGMRKAAQEHPQSYVVIDASTHRVIASGKDAVKVADHVRANLKKGQIPVFCGTPRKNQIFIL